MPEKLEVKFLKMVDKNYRNNSYLIPELMELCVSYLDNRVEKLSVGDSYIFNGMKYGLCYENYRDTCEYYDGERHGVLTRYEIVALEGPIKSTQEYVHGKKHGKKISYNRNGKIVYIEEYIQDVLVKYYEYKDGKVIRESNTLNRDLFLQEQLKNRNNTLLEDSILNLDEYKM